MKEPDYVSIGTPSRDLERRVSDLFDFSLDIARQEDDLAFRGKIHYVFDENIFELFIQPFDNYPFASLDSDIVKTRVGENPSIRHLVAMQSALFVAENLFSLRLPNQAAHCIYITHWHRWELLSRVKILMKELFQPTAVEEAAKKVLSAKQIIIDGGNRSIEAEPPDAFGLNTGLRSFKRQLNAGENALQKQHNLREAAGILSQDRFHEPLQQLRRVLKWDEDKVIADPRELVKPTYHDMQGIIESSREWERSIRHEPSGRRKPDGALRNDALSLSLISWIAGRLDHNEERIVFVTGDTSIFDAYRRRYAEVIPRPFRIRRPLQYSTLLAPRDGDDGQLQRRIFYSLQQIVELPLTPIRLGAVTDSRTPSEVLSRRQSLTLPRIEPGMQKANSSFITYFHDAWRNHHSFYTDDQIGTVEAQIELNAGFLQSLSTHFLEARITSEEREVLTKVAAAAGEDRDRILRRYVEEVIKDMIKAAVTMWRPEAEKFFASAVMTGVVRTGRSVPLAIQSRREEEYGRSDLFVRLHSILAPVDGPPRRRKQAPHTNETSSFEIFICAAAVALHANQWRLADHFCEVAINAFTYFREYVGATLQEEAEAHYFCGVAKRFRLGQIPIKEDMTAFDAAQQFFDDAAVHLEASRNRVTGSAKLFASYRVSTEFAVLCLFFGCLCKVQSERLVGVPKAAEIENIGTKTLIKAADYLVEALEIQKNAGWDKLEPQIDEPNASLIKMQLLISIATFYAVLPLITDEGFQIEKYEELGKEGMRYLTPLEEKLPNPGSSVFRAEILAFKISQGHDVEENRALLVALLNYTPDVTLEIDKTFLNIIQRTWI